MKIKSKLYFFRNLDDNNQFINIMYISLIEIQIDLGKYEKKLI